MKQVTLILGFVFLTHLAFSQWRKLDNINIDKSFRFDVDENPADQAMLYAISSEKHHLKGLLVNGYGLYSDDMVNEMLEKLEQG